MSALVIANTLGLCYESGKAFNDQHLYQSTRTGAERVYTDGTDYYCVKVTKPKAEVGQPWELMPDQFWAAKANTRIWVSKQKEPS
jgi:hypothetical protein